MWSHEPLKAKEESRGMQRLEQSEGFDAVLLA